MAFHPAFPFDVIKHELSQFITLEGQQPKSECYLPAVVQAGIEQGVAVCVDIALRALARCHLSAGYWVRVK